MSLSDIIAEDLKSRIETGENLPTSLSLIDLSSSYGVSVTPVREAVSRLVDSGYIEKLGNRRLRIAPRMIGTGGSSNATESPPMVEDWGAVLLDEVMQESLCKQAVFLREGHLAGKYHVGRSIIRQTFSEFAGAGLLDHVPRKGWLVHPVSEQDVEAYLEVREVMELKALELAKGRTNKDEVKAILDREMHGLNNAVHRYIIETSRNRYIRDFFDRSVARYFTKLFYYAAPEAEVVDEMTDHHRKILEAILRDDWSDAAQILSAHIRAQKNVLEKLVDQGLDRVTA